MSVTYIAYANGSKNGLGPADAGITIYRKDADRAMIQQENEICTWTGTEIDDEDGELDTEEAGKQLEHLGWRVAASWSRANDGQMAAEVEPFEDGRPVAGL
jgi:hypothetical protein